STVGLIQLVDFNELNDGNLLNDELGDAFAALDMNRLMRIEIDSDYLELATIMRIDEPRRICDGKTPLERHAAARLHEAGKAVRNCDGEPRSNQDTLMGWNIDGLIRA